MKIAGLFLILIFLSQTALSYFGTPVIQATNVCTYCSVDIQMLFNSSEYRSQIPSGSSSILVIQKSDSMTDVSERTAISKLLGRILWFSEKVSSYTGALVHQSQENPKVNFKLYYQLAVDQNGMTSMHSGRSKPTYEIEKEIPHELWGYCQIIDQKPHVLINEYQNVWNADYTVVHELSHIYDAEAANYIEKIKSTGEKWHELDDLAIEFRAILAEVYYRTEIRNSRHFNSEVLLKDDFRDELIIRGEVSAQRVLGFVLDLFYPIQFKKRTTLQLSAASAAGVVSQKTVIYDVVNEYFQSFFDVLKTQKTAVSVLGLNYKSVQTNQLAEINRQQRLKIIAEAQRRGAKDVFDYLIKSRLTQPMTAESVRKDGQVNQFLDRSCGPSPRGGGGSP